jgi:hypothetical protein
MLPMIGVVCSALAQPHNDNYILTERAMSSGGGSMNSDSYQVIAIVGQSSPPGMSSSANYALYSGLLGLIFDGAP